jgi:hypothetical protein
VLRAQGSKVVVSNVRADGVDDVQVAGWAEVPRHSRATSRWTGRRHRICSQLCRCRDLAVHTQYCSVFNRMDVGLVASVPSRLQCH